MSSDEEEGTTYVRRSSRANRGRRQRNKGLDQIRELRETGGRRADQYEDDEDELFEQVNDEEYRAIVEKRRDAGDFVVDDDGTGYMDDGEEHWFDRHDDSGAEEELDISEKSSTKRRDKEGKAPRREHKLSAMFLKQAKLNAARGGAASSTSKNDDAVAAEVMDDTSLDSMLAGITKAPGDRKKKRDRHGVYGRRAAAAAQAKKRKRRFATSALSSSAEWQATAEDSTDGAAGADEMDFEMPPPIPDDADDNEASAADAGESAAPADPPAPPSPQKPADSRSRLLAMARKRKTREAAAPPAPPTRQSSGPAAGSERSDLIDVADANGVGWNAGATGAGGEPGAVAGAGTGAASASTGPSKLPVQHEEGEGGVDFVRFFWLDMYEDARNRPGEVFLFGKIWIPEKNAYESCTLAVANVERVLYVLPREWRADDGDEVTTQMVYSEIRDVLQKNVLGKTQGSAFKCKPVQRNYAFELPGVPRKESQYLKVVYPMAHETGAKNVPLSVAESGGQTFSRVFGTRQSAIERLVLSRDLMGPGWLKIRSPLPLSGSGISWSRHEFRCNSPKDVVRIVENTPPPPLRVMSLSLKTAVNCSTHLHEVVLASALVRDGVMLDGATTDHDSCRQVRHFTTLRAPGKQAGAGAAAALPLDLRPRIASDPKLKGKVFLQPNERALLNFLVAQIHRHDPDVIMGHNIKGFELDVLLARMQANKVSQWSKLGRLKRTKIPKSRSGNGGRETFTGVLTPGRLLLDTYLTARELLFGERTFTLTELCRTKLGKTRREVDPMDVPLYFGTTEHILTLKSLSEGDAWLTLQLGFKLEALPLSMQLTNLGGNLWRRTLMGGRAERIEYLLLHEFHRRKYILPDKETWESKRAAAEAKGGAGKAKGGAQSRAQRRKPKYAGGLVLEPKKGLYDKYILLLDFNSLYPSIIQEYNICYTTVERQSEDATDAALRAADGAGDGQDGEDGGAAAVVDGEFELPPLPNRDVHKELAVLPSLIRALVQRRREVKGLIKKERNAAKLAQLDVRQKALKITANSMYGCLGFSNSRFFAKPLAAIVTHQGREILQNTVDLAQDKLGLEVIYGDTDSIMINTGSTDLEEVKKIGRRVKREVNALYKLLEIEQDGIFKTMLLLKKKKYAALTITERRAPDGTVHLETGKETKGLDLVRRDWCPLSKTLGHRVLDSILSGKACDEVVEGIHAACAEIAAKVKADEIPLEQYCITKGLNKSPRDYPDAKAQPHLRVAMAMMKQGKTVNTGDHIPYVICTVSREDFEREAQESAAAEGDAAAASKPKPSKAGSTKATAERAFHPDEVSKARGALHVDKEWYLAQQLLPPTSRLCDPIDGTSHGQLAEQLGLDPAKHRGRAAGYGNTDDDFAYTFSTEVNDAERYKQCKPVQVACAHCGVSYAVPGAYWTPDLVDKANAAAASQECLRSYALTEHLRPFNSKMGLKPHTFACKGCSSALVTISIHRQATAAAAAAQDSKAPPPDALNATELELRKTRARYGFQCFRCERGATMGAATLKNTLHLAARHAVSKYYEGWPVHTQT